MTNPLLKTLFRKILIPFLFLFLLATSLRGAPLAEDSYVSKKAGKFAVRPYKYGIYVSEPESGVFYNFSPYADYLQTDTGKESVVRWDEGLVSREFSYRNFPFIPTLQTVLTYFNLNSPKATFYRGTEKIEYSTDFQANKIISKLSLNSGTKSGLVRTLTFNKEDFVFDENKKMFTEKNPIQLREFKSFYGFDLTPLETASSAYSESFEASSSALPIKYITTPSARFLFIANPLTSGALRIDLKQGGVQTVDMDLKYAQVNFHMQKDASQIYVEVFDSLDEAVNSIRMEDEP